VSEGVVPKGEFRAAVEVQQIERANETGRPPVVFLHGLWLLANSWESWATRFEEAGYTALTPGWPDDPVTVDEARAHPDVFAGKTIKQIADHYAAVISRLAVKPAVIGHSFGGLLAQMIAARGLAAVSVAISPAPFRGVLPVPISALKSSWPVLRNPANRSRAVPLTYDQFRYAFANAVSEEEARRLYETYSVPGSGAMIFQAATANLNPRTEAKVETGSPERGPLLIISGDQDHTVPWSIANASFKKQRRNGGVTEIARIPDRGHSLTFDSGWREVADTALAFVERSSRL
jgi:non-heme chloroperoxidase